MTDERNFRSSYYEKVGFRSVEEKKSLEILLKERPLDKGKLKQFCLRFTVPAIHRNFLWKILLGVIPVHEDSHDFVMKQRKNEFEDLKSALISAQIMDVTTKPSQMFFTMWLLRNKRTKLDMNTQIDLPPFRSMNKMARSLWNVMSIDYDNEKSVDIYWVLCGFLDHIQKFQKDVDRLKECTCIVLEREDLELYNHLVEIDALKFLPYETWFHSCFADIISDGSITKIWDKIAVGAYKILVFVAIVILTTLRRFLLKCSKLDNVLDIIQNITEETSEVIVNKAIELWQQSGSNVVQNT